MDIVLQHRDLRATQQYIESHITSDYICEKTREQLASIYSQLSLENVTELQSQAQNVFRMARLEGQTKLNSEMFRMFGVISLISGVVCVGSYLIYKNINVHPRVHHFLEDATAVSACVSALGLFCIICIGPF